MKPHKQIKAAKITPVAAKVASHPLIEAAGNGKAEIFVAPGFIAPDACRAIVDLIDADRRPSTVADSNGDFLFRTSETCDLDPALPLVQTIRAGLFDLTGINPAHAEPLQGQRYAPGQEFKLHCDWFRPGSHDYERYCGVAGQRTWTAMAYLDEPEEGGQTVFPHLGIEIRPTIGTIVLWNNLRATGAPNPMTGHHARPVVQGVKHVITQWFRERPWTK
ncbi:2OG-Fe(II) oxygenase [Sphingosinicella sp. BN140058]|uniref:2OG-Fe(II) oxygenase n=1 Tax=Sphingosinicella sp. BN140058 TaxID=1892855 RepID=UPI001012F726|nr:2OG-Fe(II) oxygenase [Sphingosinicella sp. BN140058]QAY80422.1 oxygenase [Sphingosinicella sp. BN140058]